MLKIKCPDCTDMISFDETAYTDGFYDVYCETCWLGGYLEKNGHLWVYERNGIDKVIRPAFDVFVIIEKNQSPRRIAFEKEMVAEARSVGFSKKEIHDLLCEFRKNWEGEA